MTIIREAEKYLHEEPTAYMTKDRKIDRAFVLIEKLVKEIERLHLQNERVISQREIYQHGHKAGYSKAIDEAVKLAYDADKSTHPSDLAEKIKELKQ